MDQSALASSWRAASSLGQEEQVPRKVEELGSHPAHTGKAAGVPAQGLGEPLTPCLVSLAID